MEETNNDTIRPRRRARKKRKLKRPVIIALIVIAIIIVLVLVIHNKKKSNIVEESNEIAKENSFLIGRWTTDGNTIYEFYDDTNGSLVVPIATIPFTYKIVDNKIYIDFESEYSEDTEYEYEINDKKLTLISINGTFEFNKIDEQEEKIEQGEYVK